MEPYISEIRIFPSTRSIRNWLRCDGGLFEIQDFPTLYALIGTAYGGDGRTTFAVPNLSGATPLGQNTPSKKDPENPNKNPEDPVLSKWYPLGWRSGTPVYSLSKYDIPTHKHTMSGAVAPSSIPQITDTANTNGTSYLTNLVSKSSTGVNAPGYGYFSVQNGNLTGTTYMSDDAITSSGGSATHENMQPYLTMNYYICYEGTFPRRG